MHHTSYRAVQKCCQTYLNEEFFHRGVVTVLDMGSFEVQESGSYRKLFSDRTKYNYIGVDMAQGPNVDIVLSDPYKLPLRDGFADVIVSGQMFEHCEFFWLSFQEMVRVLNPTGYIFLVAPSAGPYHAHPVDCYRFYKDSYPALAKWADCECVEVWQDETYLWRDLTGVFRHHPRNADGTSSPAALAEATAG
ncbi:MAG: class I SAM-dependent methyltransferase [Acetobacteraceae bacterium]